MRQQRVDVVGLVGRQARQHVLQIGERFTNPALRSLCHVVEVTNREPETADHVLPNYAVVLLTRLSLRIRGF